MALAAIPGVKFTPTPTAVPTPANYLGSDDFDFLNQYYPELYNQIHNRFNSQDITGMLEHMGKEMPFESDVIKWTEEGRLTQLGTGVTRSSNVFTLNDHTFRVNETIDVRNADGSVERSGLITEVTANTFTALCGHASGWTAVGTTALTLWAYGSEFKKRTSGMASSLNSQVEYFNQNPVIIKEMVDESGSNLAQRTWLEISDSQGNTGFVWYFKNYKDTEKRFKNKIESELIKGKLWAGDLAAAGYQGTQGMFDAFAEGNLFEGPATDLTDFDEIIERMNAQGGISQNYLYNTTAQGLAMDDFLKQEQLTGLSWGAFDNNQDMALNLEFKGFHRGGFEFYKSRWRFLDDPIGEGSKVGASKVHAVMFPSGSKAVYDIIKGESATQPMMHVRYRANNKTNRKYKITITGAEAGNSRVDELITDFMTERALCVLGRNNTMIFKG
jgi:hypothetical protein